MTSTLSPQSATDVYAGPTDAPKLVRQRRIRRGWVGIGVLAIVLAALGSATLFRAVGPSQEYLAVARDVPVGTQVTSADLRVVRMNASPGLSPIPVSEVERVVGQYTAVALVAGSLLTPDHLTLEPVPGPGEQLVAISLSRDRIPGTLRGGEPVLLVATSGSGIGGQDSETAPPTFPARVHEVTSASGRGSDLVVSLVVDDRDGAMIASLAASGRVAVVLLPEGES